LVLTGTPALDKEEAKARTASVNNLRLICGVRKITSRKTTAHYLFTYSGQDCTPDEKTVMPIIGKHNDTFKN
jgi:hypothetical protein